MAHISYPGPPPAILVLHLLLIYIAVSPHLPIRFSPLLVSAPCYHTSPRRQLTGCVMSAMTSPAQCADGQQPPASPPRARTVSFEGMATGTRLDDVREVASHFGAIELLHTDGQGHGFVRFAHASAAQEFYDTLHGMDRLVSLVPDSVAPQCTSLNPEAGSTVLAPASSAASSPRAVARSLDEPPHANGQSAECGGDAGTTPRLHRDPGRLPSLLPVHIYNTSLGCTLNDIHSRLCKYGTIDDIRMLPRGAGFLVDFLAPVAAANCVAMYRLQDRDCACWASASVLRQAPTPRSQWRRSGGVPTTTATPRPAPDLPQPPLGPRQPQPPLGPRQSQPPQGPRQRSPSGRRVPAVTDEPAPGPGGAGGMSYDTRLRQAQASVLFTAIRPRMSARDVVSMLGGFGPIQAVTVVPGKTEAVITFVSQGSATRCLRSFHHRSHTVQHVSLALYLLCHPDRYPAAHPVQLQDGVLTCCQQSPRTDWVRLSG